MIRMEEKKMTIDEIKEKFNECKNSLSYKRINPNHPVNIYIGYNEKGNQSQQLFLKNVI